MWRSTKEKAMEQKQMKVFGIVCLVICAICVFVAIERYNTNAGNVRAMNSLRQSSPLGGMMGGGNMKPATPAATKYALLFAAISGIGGAVLLGKSGQEKSQNKPDAGDGL
jgi:hypothetical protein